MRAPTEQLQVQPDLHADSYERQPTDVGVDCLMDAGSVETTPTDRHLWTSQMGSHCA